MAETGPVGLHFSDARLIGADACFAAGFDDGKRRLKGVEDVNCILESFLSVLEAGLSGCQDVYPCAILEGKKQDLQTHCIGAGRG